MLWRDPFRLNGTAESFISFINGWPVDITIVDICCDTPYFLGSFRPIPSIKCLVQTFLGTWNILGINWNRNTCRGRQLLRRRIWMYCMSSENLYYRELDTVSVNWFLLRRLFDYALMLCKLFVKILVTSAATTQRRV